MQETAEVFYDNGHQAVRLPDNIHLNDQHVEVRQDERTGDIILSAFARSKGSGDFESLFQMLDEIGPAPEEFMLHLSDPVLEQEDIFGPEDSF